MSNKRKDNQTGTIRKRGNTWEGFVRLTDAFGEQDRPRFTGSTKEEVRKKITEAVQAADRGTYVKRKNLTLCDWLHTWLWDIKRSEVKEKTFDWYAELIDRYLKDSSLGKMELGDIRRYHVQKWLKDEGKKPAAPVVSLNATYGIIRNAMNEAVKQGALQESYVDKVKLLKAPRTTTQILSRKEQETFIEAIKGHRLEAAFYVTLTTGMREGEVAALKWSDFNPQNKTLEITKTAIRVNVYDEKTREKIGTTIKIQDSPKSDAGFRKQYLLPGTVKVLENHHHRQNIEKMKNRMLYQDNDLIFCNEIGQLYDPKTFYTTLRKICTETEGLKKIKFHALRHTFATRVIENEISPKVLQALLGHETPTMSLHYVHILEEQTKEAMDKLQGVF